MLNKFRGVTPDVVILIVVISILIWIGAFLEPHPPSSLDFENRSMPLFSLLLSITGFNALVSVIAAFFLVLLTAFLLVNFNTSVFFIGARTFLPALIFVLFTGLFPEQQMMNPVLPASIFLILALRRIIDAYKAQGTAYSLYDAGFLLSVGSLFYANFIWFGILLIAGIALLRTGNLREIVISLLGLATPWFLVFGFYYVLGKDLNGLNELIRYNLSGKESGFALSRVTIAVLIIDTIILLISTANLITVINKKKIRSRKTFVLLIWAFLIAIGTVIFVRSVSVEIFWLAAVPASYFISHYFVFAGRRRIIPEVYFLILFLGIALTQVLHHIQ
ncbi:MAG: hypothetical protein GYA41_04410 [Bacteroidales bacterium]|nr:hypothetical protein [Bacteroidales bacterium]